MVRFITAIVLGYLVMLIVVMGIFTVAYPMVGVDRLFEPGTYEAARGWIVLNFAIGLVAAMMAGSFPDSSSGLRACGDRSRGPLRPCRRERWPLPSCSWPRRPLGFSRAN